MSSERVPILFLAPHGGDGWKTYTRYEGDDVYVVHACSVKDDGRQSTMHFLSRDAAVEYLRWLVPSRDVELALLAAPSSQLRKESFAAYDDAARTSQEFIGEDFASNDSETLRGCLLLLRDGRCAHLSA